MRLAFVSHEFSPGPGSGGIATYLHHVTEALARCGHEVHVYCGAEAVSGSHRRDSGVIVHRIAAAPGNDFRAAVVPAFRTVHETTPFDVLEGTDFDAPGNLLKRLYPELPYVVKLHTPRFVIDELHAPPLGWAGRLRMRLGAWRRGQRYAPPPRPSAGPEAAEEKAALSLADKIAAPSHFVAAAASTWTPLDPSKLSVLPYPFSPSGELLAVPENASGRSILFLGRIEVRKGVLDLAAAAAHVRAALPDARFVFAGRITGTTPSGANLPHAMRRLAGPAADALHFTGPVPPSKVPELLADCAVLALPSHWESFGLVCCEALGAGRPVVATTTGGMREILDENRCGRLVPPRHPRVLAEALIELLVNPRLRQELGQAGRARIHDFFTPERVLPRQLNDYERARARCRASVR